MRVKYLLSIILCCNALALWGTHNRAGEITYTHVSGLTYEFTITTFTYTPSPADRPEIGVYWGDGSFSTIQRDSKVSVGEDISRNTYKTRHTFAVAGTYVVYFEDPNRNAGVVNIPNSVNIPFYIETELVINPFLGNNSSPTLQNPPIDNGCVNVPYEHNPGALDPDGDSLSYELVECRGYEGEVIPGYTFPPASSYIDIDPITGTLIWDSPQLVGEYNLAIRITEWRYGIKVSAVTRDMQILIAPCENDPPEIEVEDTCVVAGTYLELPITVTDPNEESTNVTLSAVGKPLEMGNASATISPKQGTPTLEAFLNWQTNCNMVNPQPYTITLKAKDNGPIVPLSTFETVNIQVFAPKPENLTATPQLNAITLQWDMCVCTNAMGYDIYKKRGDDEFEPDYCETGLPTSAGYTLIGSTEGHDAISFVDDGSVMPLLHANEYCYRVVAFFANGAESVVSDKICAYIANDAPLMTKVSVLKTHETDGLVEVQWVAPPEIDSIATPPPYFYQVLKVSSENDEDTEVIANFSADEPYSYIDTVNTKIEQHQYQVEFWCEGNGIPEKVETADPASSIFLTIEPSDRQLRLQWNGMVPWDNYEYVIYRKNEHANAFDSIATTYKNNYTDRGLINSKNYCYYVKTIGAYWLPDTLKPLINYSQEACAVPKDITPPEMPTVEIFTDCEEVRVEWTFSSDTAHQDVFTYYIYYKPNYKAAYYIIDSIQNNGSPCYPNSCVHFVENMPSITGCYQMAAIDTNNNISPKTPAVCFDYTECMDYRLPNVFTPNSDGINDLWQPYPYSNVDEIQLFVHNRWGRKVFETTDPDINWDGRDYLTKELLPEGNYYYSCQVKLYTLEGVKHIPMNGVVMIFYTAE